MISESIYKSFAKIAWIYVLQIGLICCFSANSVIANEFETPIGNNAFSELQDDRQEKQDIIYLVDGEPMSAKEVDKIKIENIEQVEYVKDKEKIKQYTDEETDVVVLITTKNQKKKEE